MKTGMTIDSKEFGKNLNKLAKKATGEQLEKAMGRAGLLLLRDTIMETPTVPLLTGDLRGSGSVIVNSKKVADSSALGLRVSNPNESHNNTVSGGMVATVGFNMPYASKLHENPQYRFSEASAGGNYILTKLQRYKKQYFKAIADYLKEKVFK